MNFLGDFDENSLGFVTVTFGKLIMGFENVKKVCFSLKAVGCSANVT